MLNQAICIHRRMHQPSVRRVFHACDNTNGQLMYVVLSGGCTQEDTLPDH